ncbi:MAG: FYVE zinc finger domain-containing protein [Desulfobacteraceae bacterium]|nr:FYVE zinc finger domain-containing protein [Desulfobacteraceae bacterium]
MPTKTEQLIQCISGNGTFVNEWPWDPKKPLDSLQYYLVWLSRQAQLMHGIESSDDTDLLTHFCMVVLQNRDLMRFLEPNRITEAVILDYLPRKFPKPERDNFFRLYRIWVDDQFELIGDSVEEGRIEKALGAENRRALRENLALLEQAIEEGQAKKGIEKTKYKSLEEIKEHIISVYSLDLKPRDTTPEKLMRELDSRMAAKQKEIQKLQTQVKKGVAPTAFHGNVQNFKNSAAARCELLQAQNNVLLSFRKQLLESMQQVKEARQATAQGLKKEESLLRAKKGEVQSHIKEVAKGKKGLDPYLSSTREDVKNQIEQLNEELLPLLQNISDLNTEIVEDRAKLPAAKDRGALERQIQEKEARLDAMYNRKDTIFLKIGHLQERVATLKNAYQAQLSDERQFEDHAKHQLNLLKTIPRIEKALNIYCSYYKGAFPLFLYIGSFVRGDGDILQSPSLIGKGMDLLLKLPMVGAGLTDIEKCKAYDTGSMILSLKLGLSIGVDAESIVAKAGLAVEYNAGISVGDERTFQTTAAFALKAAAEVEIGTFFKLGLEAEILSWKGGFIYQDHYHWAAWLAARWGHFCARARACDVYLSNANVGPDYRPDQRALDELDKLTEKYLNDDEMVQAVYAEIRQYLDYPVIRSRQIGYFEKGSLNVGLLGAELNTSGSFKPAEPDMMVVKIENGKAVEYKATYETSEFGGSFSFGGYTLAISASETKECPITQNDGINIKVTFSPVPAPELWVLILDIFMGVLSGSGDAKARILNLVRENVKLAAQRAITAYASGYVLEKTKSIEFNFFMTQDKPCLWYVRTSVAFGKTFEKSVPVWEFVYVDLGAQFNYTRSFSEGLGWNTITYAQFVHHGFKGVLKQKQPLEGKKVYTLRPDTMSGEALWKKFVDAHKHDFWHMFMAIGTGDANTVIRKELAGFSCTSLVQNLVSLCQAKAKTGKYKLPGEGLVPYVTGYLQHSPIQAMNVLIKHTITVKNADGFDQISADYDTILKAFNDVLDAEYVHIKADEDANFARRFSRVMPPPKTVDQEVGDIFRPRDDMMAFDIGWAAQLQQETGKALKSCEKCLQETRDYDLARDTLLVALLPEKYWVEDKEISTCMACHLAIKPGAFSSNKHHCRICGGIFCEKCCPSTKVDVNISKSKIRVCLICKGKIDASKTAQGLPMPFSLPRASKPKATQPVSAAVRKETVTHEGTPSAASTAKQQPLMTAGKPRELPGKSLMWSDRKAKSGAFNPKRAEEVKKPTGTQQPEVAQAQATSATQSPGTGAQNILGVGVRKPRQPAVTEWYSDDHINFLLEHYLADQHDTAVVGGISAHLQGGGTLRDNLQDRCEIAFVQNQSQMVVPVNIYGSHWVAVYIHFVNPDYTAPHIIHIDPYGSPITPDLAGALDAIFPRRTIEDAARRYQNQTDTKNCGPWTIALLEYLAKNNGNKPDAGWIDINRRRTQDMAILA